MRWNESVTLSFVRIYLTKESLWNPDHPAYKVKAARDIAYKKIAFEFREITGIDLTTPQVKLKIKNLRTTYLQQVHKVLEKSRPGHVHRPHLIWFQEMDNCLNKVPVISYSSTPAETEQNEEVDSSEMWVRQEPTADENPDPLVENSLMAVDYEDPVKQPTKFKNKKIKRKKFKFEKKLVLTPDSNTSTESMNVNEDEFDIYGKSIASQLRKMSLRKALRLQMEIQSLISNARMADL